MGAKAVAVRCRVDGNQDADTEHTALTILQSSMALKGTVDSAGG